MEPERYRGVMQDGADERDGDGRGVLQVGLFVVGLKEPEAIDHVEWCKLYDERTR